MTDITKKFREGQCVYITANPETKMTIASYHTRKTMSGKTELTGFVYCTWLFNGEVKEGKVHQDALTPCSENKETSSS